MHYLVQNLKSTTTTTKNLCNQAVKIQISDSILIFLLKHLNLIYKKYFTTIFMCGMYFYAF